MCRTTTFESDIANATANTRGRMDPTDDRGTGSIREGHGARRVEDREVGLRADAQLTDVVAAKRRRSPARGRPQGVVEVHAHVANRDGQYEGHTRHVRSTWIAVR